MFSIIFISISILLRTKKPEIRKKKILLFFSSSLNLNYFIPGIGKIFASRLSVFNGGPLGVSRCGICERSEYDTRG